MSVDTVRTLTERHQGDPSSVWPNGLPERFSFVDFPDFGRQFFYGLSLLRSSEDIATATDAIAATLARQNVRYAEVTTTAYSHFLDRSVVGKMAMTPAEYSDGLTEGRRRAAARGVEIGWVVDIPRDLEPPESTVTIDYLASNRTPEGLVAIGLGGFEIGNPAAPYRPHFERAKSLGLHSLPHAGENAGAESVRSAVVDLGAERIGHGVRCLEDSGVVQMLRERQIMLEVCPTSNLLLGVVNSLEDHPLPALREAGLRVCLNSDDPGWFATDLMTELTIASELLGVTDDDHRKLQLDAVSASFAPESVKTAIRAELASVP